LTSAGSLICFIVASWNLPDPIGTWGHVAKEILNKDRDAHWNEQWLSLHEIVDGTELRKALILVAKMTRFPDLRQYLALKMPAETN
jgi:hypothetical protein